MVFCAVAGLCSNITGGGLDLNSEIQAMQRWKVSSSTAGVNSARLRPKAMRSSQSARCVDVSTQAPASGIVKKVSGHHSFKWSICATGPAPEENEPAEEPEDQELTSDDQEICNNNHVSDEVTASIGASDVFEDELPSIEEFSKRKVRIYEEYITQDHLSDDDALAKARDLAEAIEQINALKVINQLEELYQKTSNGNLKAMLPALFNFAWLAIISGIFVLAGVAFYKVVLSEPISQLLHSLLPTIRVYRDVIYYALKHGRFDT